MTHTLCFVFFPQLVSHYFDVIVFDEIPSLTLIYSAFDRLLACYKANKHPNISHLHHLCLSRLTNCLSCHMNQFVWVWVSVFFLRIPVVFKTFITSRGSENEKTARFSEHMIAMRDAFHHQFYTRIVFNLLIFGHAIFYAIHTQSLYLVWLISHFRRVISWFIFCKI